MINKILVIGDGQLGKSIKSIALNYSEYKFTFVSRVHIDLSLSSSISNFFIGKDYDLIINCAAYTNVDNAESEFNVANKVNHLAVKQIASIAKKKRSKLIHISTDYVFDGTKKRPYNEMDKPNPKNIYGKTKLDGEQSIINALPKGALIIRTSWVYSEYGNNFLKTMLRLARDKKKLNIIDDQIGSPTYARDLSEVIMCIVGNSKFRNSNFDTNIVHYSNEGKCSWYDFAQKIFELENIKIESQPINTKDYNSLAQRPAFAVLDKNKIKNNFNIEIPHWSASLKKSLTFIGKI
jgi:dTDP-4-dehydrorhamnose reductase